MDGSCFVSHVWTLGRVRKSPCPHLSSSLINMLHDDKTRGNYCTHGQEIILHIITCKTTTCFYTSPSNFSNLTKYFLFSSFLFHISALTVAILHCNSLWPWLDSKHHTMTYLISGRRGYSRKGLETRQKMYFS